MTYCDEQKKSPFASVEAKNIIKEALNVLGKKHFAFIAHSSGLQAKQNQLTLHLIQVLYFQIIPYL